MLINIKDSKCMFNQAPQISYYFGLLYGVWDNRTSVRIVGANIDAIRTFYPYAYLLIFGGGGSETDGFEEIDGDPDIDFSGMLQIEAGFDISSKKEVDFNPVRILPILKREIRPFVYSLKNQSFHLICSPDQDASQNIRTILIESRTREECLRRLLANEGCILTAVDHYVFEFQTYSHELITALGQ